jgi:DNA invertase Pin-like site-specific DNA recombinase
MARKSRKQSCIEAEKTVIPKIFSVGAYTRLSALDNKKRGDSIETQQAIISAFVAERDDLRIGDVYIDNGLSGQYFERPAFQRMITDLETGKIDCCITKDLSRLGRNAIDTGYYIEHYFPANNVRYIAINDDYDSISAHSGGITIALKNLINEHYALESARKARASKQMIIRNGGYIGGMPPFGYIKNPDDRHKLIKDDEAANIVASVFRLYTEGHSIKEIQAKLNQDGVLPPIRYFQSKGVVAITNKKQCEFWHLSVVSKILRNRIYCGDNVQGKTACVNYVLRHLPEEEWVITENTHEAIINRELYFRVQDMLLEQKQKSMKNPETTRFKSPPTENIFKGKIICGKCGYNMVRDRKGNDIYYIMCRKNYNVNNAVCSETRIKERHFKDAVFSVLTKQAAILTEQTQIMSDDGSAKNPGNYLKMIQIEIERNKLFLKGLYENLITNIITDDEYRDMKESYEAKLASLFEQETQERERIRRNIESDIKIESASSYLFSLSCADDLTAEIIDALVEKIIVYEDMRLEFTFRFKDEVVEIGGCND